MRRYIRKKGAFYKESRVKTVLAILIPLAVLVIAWVPPLVLFYLAVQAYTNSLIIAEEIVEMLKMWQQTWTPAKGLEVDKLALLFTPGSELGHQLFRSSHMTRAGYAYIAGVLLSTFAVRLLVPTGSFGRSQDRICRSTLSASGSKSRTFRKRFPTSASRRKKPLSIATGGPSRARRTRRTVDPTRLRRRRRCRLASRASSTRSSLRTTDGRRRRSTRGLCWRGSEGTASTRQAASRRCFSSTPVSTCGRPRRSLISDTLAGSSSSRSSYPGARLSTTDREFYSNLLRSWMNGILSTVVALLLLFRSLDASTSPFLTLLRHRLPFLPFPPAVTCSNATRSLITTEPPRYAAAYATGSVPLVERTTTRSFNDAAEVETPLPVMLSERTRKESEWDDREQEKQCAWSAIAGSSSAPSSPRALREFTVDP